MQCLNSFLASAHACDCAALKQMCRIRWGNVATSRRECLEDTTLNTGERDENLIQVQRTSLHDIS